MFCNKKGNPKRTPFTPFLFDDLLLIGFVVISQKFLKTNVS
jgi:hypothetical protein